MALRRGARVGLVLLVVGAAIVVGAVVASERLFRQPLLDGCSANVGGVTTRLTVEEAENAALISASSVRRGMPARAATIALATAFQESGMRNIDYGHLDSLGLFQQRPSQGWGTPQEILDPYYATERFYAALAKIHGYTEMDIAHAAQLVQRSADEAAYAQHETSARGLASSLTGQSRGAFSCELRETPTGADPAALRSELAKAFGAPGGSTVGIAATAARVPGAAVLVRTDDGDAMLDVPVSAASPALGWSVAQWAVAYAQRYGVVSVTYGDRSWSAERSKDGWRSDTESSPGRVRLVLASS